MGDDDEEIKAQGTCSGSTVLHKKFPCPIPEICAKKNPLDYTEWGAHECEIKEYGEYGEKLTTITWAKIYEVYYTRMERRVLPEFIDDKKTTKFPISEFVIETLQVNYQGEVAKQKQGEKKEEKKTKDTNLLENRLEEWKFVSWKYHDALAMPENDEEIKKRWKNFKIQLDFGDSWTGNEQKTEFQIRTTLIPFDEEPEPKIFVEKKLVDKDEYEVDVNTGKVLFKNPPADCKSIRIIYYWSIKPADLEDSKSGASLFYSNEIGQVETFTVKDEEKKEFILQGVGVRKNSIEVKVGKKIMIRGNDYFLTSTWNEKRERVFKVNFVLLQPKGTEIDVYYKNKPQADVSEEVSPIEFSRSKERALEALEEFAKVLRNANPDWFKKEGKENKLEEVKKNVGKWEMPRPSRLMTDAEDKLLTKLVPYTAECVECGHVPMTEKNGETEPIEFKIPLNTEIKSKCEQKKPDGSECGGKLKIGNFFEIQKFDPDPIGLQWFADETTHGKIVKETVRSCKTEPLAIFFKKDQPLPGETRAEIESEIVNAKKMEDPKHPGTTLNLEQIAGLVYKQILKFRNEGLIPVIYYWGYADMSAPKTHRCDYNEKLSLRRADWVQWKIERFLQKKFNIEKGIATPVIEGCGEGYNDEAKTDDKDRHRVVIIEIDYARQTDDFPTSEDTRIA